MLKVTNLTKTYGNSDKKSVDNLSLELKPGEVFGFLGPNGAGKSTTIKSIVGILPYEEGQIEICGLDVKHHPIECKKNIGYVPDNHALFERLTGREYVNHVANLYGVPKEQMEEIIKNWRTTENPETCPHGRPVSKFFEHKDLAKFFQRNK